MAKAKTNKASKASKRVSAPKAKTNQHKEANMAAATEDMEEMEQESFDEEDDIEDDVEEVEEAEASRDDKTEGESSEKKTRAPRQIIFFCSANVSLPKDIEGLGKKGERKLVQDPINVTSPARDQAFNDAAGQEEARRLFQEKWGCLPEAMSKAAYIRKGTVVTRNHRDTINISVGSEAKFTGKSSKAIHKDWEVLVQHTSKPDTVFVIYGEPTEKAKKAAGDKKLTRPTPKYIKASALKDVQENA